jgi:hypothetical protein
LQHPWDVVVEDVVVDEEGNMVGEEEAEEGEEGVVDEVVDEVQTNEILLS